MRPDFIGRCRDAGPLARCVKLLDIDDNSNPIRLSMLDKQTYARLANKYSAARAQLQEPTT